MPGIAFKIETYLRRVPSTGAVEIDIIPNNPNVELTDQQILDAVAEMLLWSPVEIKNQELDS